MSSGVRSLDGNEAPASDPSADRFCAVVVNYNGREMLSSCLESLREQGVPAEQIVLVDNGSSDRSVEYALERVSGIVTMRNGCNAGFARAVNQGLACCHKEFVLLLNNDARLLSGALGAFAGAFDSIPSLGIAGGQLLFPDGRPQHSIAAIPTVALEILPKWCASWRSRRQKQMVTADGPVPVESVIGACLAVRGSAIRQVGGLDEEYFFFLEETEWCLRMRQRGFLVCHVPGARAVHAQGKTVGRFHTAGRIEFQRSKLTFFRKTKSAWSYGAASMLLPLKALVNALANTLLVACTVCTNRRLRLRTAGYWQILWWHLRGRPDDIGLPDKCTGGRPLRNNP